MIPALIMILAIGSGALAVYQYSQQQAAERKAEKAQNDLAIKQDELIRAHEKIEELQTETIRQVVGYGHPYMVSLDDPSGNIKFAIRGSTDYPIYNLNITVLDALKLKNCKTAIDGDKIVVARSCYESAIHWSGAGTIDLNGTLYQPINLLLKKTQGSTFLVTNFLSKHLRAVQYSVLVYDSKQNAVGLYYRIYAISKKDNSFGDLLAEVNPNNVVPEEIWQQNFHFKKTIITDHTK
jgi:hypothetical protein